MGEGSGTGSTPGPGTFLGVWANRRWRWLISAFSVSMLGDFLYWIALVAFLMKTTGSAGWVSAAVLGRTVPYVLLSVPAGVLADRMDRRRLMVILDLARGVVLAAMALLVWVDGPPLVAVLLAVGNSMISTAHRPAAVAATPLLVSEDDLAVANAAETIVAQLAWFAGPALGTVIVATLGMGSAIMFNALTFVVSAILVARVGDVGGGADTTGPTPETEPDEGAVGGLRAGIRAVRDEPALSALVIFSSGLLFGFGMEQVLHVMVAVDRLGMEPEWVGVMGSAVGIGGLVVAPFTARLARTGSMGWLLVFSGLAAVLPLAALAVTTSRIFVLGILVLEGAGIIVNEVLWVTFLQRACPDHLLARVFGIQESATSAAQLMGAVLAPVLVAAAGLGTSLFVGGLLPAVIALLSAPVLVASSRQLTRRRAPLTPIIDLFRELQVFTGISEAAAERLARSTLSMDVEPGISVIQQGDVPADFYVIKSGEMVVTHRSETGEEIEVNRMGPLDWFGEIGLLRGTPRSATVTAASACEILVVPGEVFLDTLAAPEILPDPILRTVDARLARTAPFTRIIR